jgi:hypothetical protein
MYACTGPADIEYSVDVSDIEEVRFTVLLHPS